MIACFRVRTVLQTKTDFFLFLVNYTFDNTDPEFGSQNFFKVHYPIFIELNFWVFFRIKNNFISVKCTKVQKTLLG